MKRAFLFLILSIGLFSESTFGKEAKKKVRQKITSEDAKEICLVNMGASVRDEVLDKCIKKVMKTGKFKRELKDY